ncbi:MAG: hypothetical protein ABJN20_12195, partial [Lentilitoribacter sp.]
MKKKEGKIKHFFPFFPQRRYTRIFSADFLKQYFLKKTFGLRVSIGIGLTSGLFLSRFEENSWQRQNNCGVFFYCQVSCF